MSAKCGYTHDVSGDRFGDLDGETWTCTHDAALASDRCVFHAPPGTEVGGSARERLLETVGNREGPLRLVGARLASLDLDHAILGGPSNHPIDMRDVTVEGDLSVRFATVSRPLRLDGGYFRGSVTFEDTTFSRRVDLGGATFEGRVSFRMADFESWLDLRETDFHGPVYARVARFRRGIYGVDASFHAAADLLNTRFDDVANFFRAEFRSGAVFDSTTFEGDARFVDATFESPTVKLISRTGSPRSRRETMEDVALSMDRVICERDVRLDGANVGGDVVFTESDLGRDVRCPGLSAIDGGTVVDCSGTAIVTGTVDGDDGRISYDLSDAEVGEVTIADGSSFDVFRFDATTFRGFDFGAYKRELAAADWRLHSRDEPYVPERLENLYLRAKNGAKDIGESRAASEFFIKEMDYRRHGHRERVVRSEGLTESVRAATSWLSNATLKVSCGYGERPFRPVVFSAVLIAVFAVIYSGLGVPIAYSGPLGYAIFSIEGFVSLVLGLPETTGSVVSFVLAVEAFMGGFVIALFVFTLTRSISR